MSPSSRRIELSEDKTNDPTVTNRLLAALLTRVTSRKVVSQCTILINC